MALQECQQEMRSCTRCVAAGYLAVAHPVFRGDAAQRLMIVGQAPGRLAHEQDEPWAGPGGDVLRGWLARAGFPAESFHETWYLTSLTKCFPGSARQGAGDRAPSRAEQRLCEPFLEQEIVLVRPVVIVTLGRLAVARLIPSVRQRSLQEFIGDVFPIDLGYGEVPILPLPHPSGVSRWLNDPANRALTERALAKLAALARERDLLPRLT